MHAKRESRKSKSRPTLETLKTLKDHLDGLDGLIPSVPIYLEKEEKAEKQESEKGQVDEMGDSDDEPADDEYEEVYVVDDHPAGAIECEEIEFAIDGLLTDLNVLFDSKTEAKTLSDLFEEMFGEDAEIIDTVVEFEEAINGYFGWLFGDEAERAHGALATMVEFIEGRIEEWKMQDHTLPL
jgi:hypothetical protein